MGKMSRRTVTRTEKFAWVSGLFLLVAGMAACWFMITDAEPRFQGRALSEWFLKAENSEELMVALRAMETDAVPFLTRRLRWTPSVFTRIHGRLNDVSSLRSFIPPSSDPRALAAYGLGLYGPTARQALPELERVLTSTSDYHVRLSATFAVLRIRGQPPTDYIDTLADTSDAAAPKWFESVSIIKMYGKDASNAIPNLIKALSATNNANSCLIQAHACEALGAVKSQPEVCVPALVEAFGSSDVTVRQMALLALIQFGQAAQASRAAVVLGLRDANPWIRTNSAHLLGVLEAETPSSSKTD
jgi:HEAT repeat protein